jgi:hypothetical protein
MHPYIFVIFELIIMIIYYIRFCTMLHLYYLTQIFLLVIIINKKGYGIVFGYFVFMTSFSISWKVHDLINVTIYIIIWLVHLQSNPNKP